MHENLLIVMFALVGLALTAQTAYGVGVNVLSNGTLVPNNAPAGSKNNMNYTGGGTLVAVSGPTKCHKTSEGYTCESDTWVPVIGQTSNHTIILANGTRIPPSHLNIRSNATVSNMTDPPSNQSYADYKRNVF